MQNIMYIFYLMVQGHCLGHTCDVNGYTVTLVSQDTAVRSRSNHRLVVWGGCECVEGERLEC